LRMYYN